MYCLTFKLFCYSEYFYLLTKECYIFIKSVSITVVLKLKGLTILCLTQIEIIKSLISIKVYMDFKM